MWLFSLVGKLGPAKSLGKSGGVLHEGEKPSAGRGQTVFAANCAVCHGSAGQGGNGGPNLQNRPNASNLQRVVQKVVNGGGGMPPFKGTLSSRQIEDVATFVTEKIARPQKNGSPGRPG